MRPAGLWPAAGAPVSTEPESPDGAQRDLLRKTVRINALIFGALLGLLCGSVLFALAMAAQRGAASGLIVSLLAVFLPGYAVGGQGALLGLFWGFVAGAVLGSGIYWINYRSLLPSLDKHLVASAQPGGDLPAAILRLRGPSLGLAIGSIGALGLVATTSWLVVRGTAAEDLHAGLLAEILPGYAVSFGGGVVAAVEFFVILYALALLFASIYNRVVTGRRHEG